MARQVGNTGRLDPDTFPANVYMCVTHNTRPNGPCTLGLESPARPPSPQAPIMCSQDKKKRNLYGLRLHTRPFSYGRRQTPSSPFTPNLFEESVKVWDYSAMFALGVKEDRKPSLRIGNTRDVYRAAPGNLEDKIFLTARCSGKIRTRRGETGPYVRCTYRRNSRDETCIADVEEKTKQKQNKVAGNRGIKKK